MEEPYQNGKTLETNLEEPHHQNGKALETNLEEAKSGNMSSTAREESEEEPIIGPGLAPHARSKRPLQFEQAYLDALPSAPIYEKSYMHREVVTHVAVSVEDFIITES